MAQSTQIIPRFLHSHVDTIINDYTQFEDTVRSDSDDSVKFLAVFLGPKGIDNTLVKVRNIETFERIYGRSNYALYGQPMMMAEAELRSGQATCWCMRVMPDDAKYANSVLSIYYKADVAKKKFRVKFKAKSLTAGKAITSKEDMYTKGRELDGSAVGGVYKDSDGYTQIPFMTFRTTGRGEYGNNFRWRISRSKDGENDYRIKVYNFEALDGTSGITSAGLFRGSVVESDKFRRTTLINDVLDDTDLGIAPIDFQVYDDNFETLYGEYVKFLTDVKDANPSEEILVPDRDEFDIFFGLGVANDVKDVYLDYTRLRTPDSHTLPGYDADDYSDDTDMIIVDNVEGTMLGGGDDGKFKDSDPDEVNKAIIASYKKAFDGTYDPTILSNKRTHVHAIFDANYPYETKVDLATLALKRNDAMCFIDAGLIPSFSSAQQQQLADKYNIFNTRGISKNPQWYLIKDPVTRKRVPVTITYLFAERYAEHWKLTGNHVPFTNTRCQLTGHIRNSLQPSVEEHEENLKEWLYVNRFNYFEAQGEDIFKRACQNTAQVVNSDLLEENNMNVLFEIKHILEVDAKENSYNFAEESERRRFTEYERAKFAPWIGRKVSSFEIEFRMSPWEAERSILHCYVAVQFRTLVKRTLIEIDVNKRDFTI